MSKEGYPVINPKEILNQGDGDKRDIGRIDDIEIAAISAHAEEEFRREFDNETPESRNFSVDQVAIGALQKRSEEHMPAIASSQKRSDLRSAVRTSYIHEQHRLRKEADRIAGDALAAFKEDTEA